MSTETKTAHTPGPWTVVDGPATLMGDCYLSHQIWGKQRLAFIEAQNTGVKVADANARLMAAAPDLLASLRRLTDLCEREEWHDYMVDGRTAIAKAEGR